MDKIRNFAIIAHIDHGKSTLSDQLIRATKTISTREMRDRILDDMDLEKEKGITIKARTVTMFWTSDDGNGYQLNLIDTPGHVDFSHEVSRSLSACEGALLVIDSSQGVQAQTLANVYLAMDSNITIVPVINKIDLPSADIAAVSEQIEDIIGIDREEIILCSAKSGDGITNLLRKIVSSIPPPANNYKDDHLRALIFDSYYDAYRGVISCVRVVSGFIEKGSKVRMMATDKPFEVTEVGILSIKEKETKSLSEGEVGYVIANIRERKEGMVVIGDTITTQVQGATTPLKSFKEVKPVVYAGIYPTDTSDFKVLSDSFAKLQLNDPSLHVERESNPILGLGFRCGFLGVLHLEITFERLKREFHLDIITTSPNVTYQMVLSDGSKKLLDNPTYYPDPSSISSIEEPWSTLRLVIPSHFFGPTLSLITEKRGSVEYTESSGGRMVLTCNMPTNEIIRDFSDRLKSITSGYGSFDYEFSGYRESNIVKLDILVNGEIVEPFSLLVHRTKAEAIGRAMCEKLLKLIPPQIFKVPIQAAIWGNKIIARETVPMLSKHVTAKCYGGDRTRKEKLWKKQKEGKKLRKLHANIKIPQSVYMKVFKDDN